MKKQSLQAIAIGSLCFICNAAIGEDGVVTYFSAGLLYSNGNASLGDIDSKTYSIPLMLSTSYQQINASLATSYVRGENNETGLGDTTFSLGYDFGENSDWSLILKEKFATGDERIGLSTGENDTSLQLDYFKPLNDRVSFMGSVGYTFVGKPDQSFGSSNNSPLQKNQLREEQQQSRNPSNAQSGMGNNSGQSAGAGKRQSLQDSRYASTGIAYILSDKTNIGMLIDYQQSIYQSLNDETGLSLFVNRSLSSNWGMSGLLAYDNLHTSSLGFTLTTRFK